MVLTISGCRHLAPENETGMSNPEPDQPANFFTVPGQVINHPDLYSLQLFRKNSEQSAPIIRLNSSQQLVLRFDMIESGTRQFKITITHHNPDWSRSSLPPEFYMDGFTEAIFGDGKVSNSQRPSYRQYEYLFPNNQLSLTESGNFMIRVEDFETQNLIISLPFFVHENEGEIRSSIETIYAPRRGLRILHQTNSRFVYPDFVDMPRFDLEFYFTQNRFWGRTQKADAFDTTTPGAVYYETSRNQAFVGDYEFRLLEIPQLTLRGPGIIGYEPGFIPPRLILNTDVQGLSPPQSILPGSRLGTPKTELNARYGDVYFNLRTEQDIKTNQEIFLVGDFNNWAIQDHLKLRYQPEIDEWTVNTFIKEGTYSYKYVLMEDGNVYDLELDNTFTRSRQEYTTFVYYRDPGRHHYRLLQANIFYSN